MYDYPCTSLQEDLFRNNATEAEKKRRKVNYYIKANKGKERSRYPAAEIQFSMQIVRVHEIYQYAMGTVF